MTPSGTTLMSYAGICGRDDIQSTLDPYFNYISRDTMWNYAVTAIGTVGTQTLIPNFPPYIISYASNVYIPTGTPFEVHALFGDYESDPITYTFEENNHGAAQNLGDPDNGPFVYRP